MPVEVPQGVTVNIKGKYVHVKGPKGQMEHTFPASMKISLKDGEVIVERPSDERTHRALHGITRAIINNMVVGVDKGFQKVLEINGVGYRAVLSGKKLTLNVGYSHPVDYALPDGISALVEGNTITINGIDKQLVGEVAAQIRKVRKPEPYKGKGIKYFDEVIRRKEGKAAVKGE